MYRSEKYYNDKVKYWSKQLDLIDKNGNFIKDYDRYTFCLLKIQIYKNLQEERKEFINDKIK